MTRSSFGETSSETAFIEDNGMAERAALLLGTDADGLKAALVNKTVEAAGESIQGSNNMEQVQQQTPPALPLASHVGGRQRKFAMPWPRRCACCPLPSPTTRNTSCTDKW